MEASPQVGKKRISRMKSTDQCPFHALPSATANREIFPLQMSQAPRHSLDFPNTSERPQMHLAAHTQTTSPAPTRPARLLRLSEVEMRCSLK
ncbi:hypothetical protein, partial [Paenacidovorax caeni]|uniref:hypothetical protein n=1 Tax=Paenacidovorax caeni TaxID=343013 RepID=UPI001F1921DD